MASCIQGADFNQRYAGAGTTMVKDRATQPINQSMYISTFLSVYLSVYRLSVICLEWSKNVNSSESRYRWSWIGLVPSDMVLVCPCIIRTPEIRRCAFVTRCTFWVDVSTDVNKMCVYITVMWSCVFKMRTTYHFGIYIYSVYVDIYLHIQCRYSQYIIHTDYT